MPNMATNAKRMNRLAMGRALVAYCPNQCAGFYSPMSTFRPSRSAKPTGGHPKATIAPGSGKGT